MQNQPKKLIATTWNPQKPQKMHPKQEKQKKPSKYLRYSFSKISNVNVHQIVDKISNVTDHQIETSEFHERRFPNQVIGSFALETEGQGREHLFVDEIIS